jgi:hypothetical protein
MEKLEEGSGWLYAQVRVREDLSAHTASGKK